MAAVKDCHLVLRRHFEMGHDLKTKGRDGWTPCERAAVRGCWMFADILRILVEFDEEVKDRSLYEAVSTRDQDKLGHWLYAPFKMDMEAKYSDNETLMYRCIANGWTDIAETLLDAGADPNIVSHNHWNAAGYKHGETLLYRAASELDFTMVRLLLKKGAKVDAKSRASETALYRIMCCTHGKADDQAQIAGLLLESGADISFRTGNGDTPLQNALRVGREPLTRLLKEAAEKLGLDGTILLTAPERTELSETAGKEEEALRLIEQSRLFDMENFNDLLSFDTEDEGPEHGFSRKCYERSFWNIRPWIQHIRDDV